MIKSNNHDDLLLESIYVMDRHAIAFLDVYSVYIPNFHLGWREGRSAQTRPWPVSYVSNIDWLLWALTRRRINSIIVCDLDNADLTLHYSESNHPIPKVIFSSHTPHCMCFFVSEPTFADSYSFSISLFRKSVSLFIPIITHISALSSALERYCSYFFVWCNSLSQRNIKNYIEGNEQGELKFNFQNVWFGIIWIWQYKQGTRYWHF